ncbi:hypothetical protein ILUMI_18189 [Ignelater luminosus]|uniref:Lipase domain-containing protein n=1 Tax=Ignelater luminosus TaxID=2038154 RepID=A0A8K0G6M4_IGNLU|nr:hypothetical protein ILUMI_18189 [Ignelater luminosus]
MHVAFSIILLVIVQVYSQSPAWNIFVNEDDVKFYLYNRENHLEPILITKNNLNALESNKSVKLVIHGFFENARRDWYKNMTREYLKKDDFNIIQVDWSKPASSGYSISAGNTKYVGIIIGKLISELSKNQKLPLKNVHIIGHSLGAHVAGYAGKEVIRQMKSPIGRITALDAAAPLFEGTVDILVGLEKGDAEIVDAIHTDGGFFGRKNAIGTVDFFPNGGTAPQPGCSIRSLKFPPRNYVEVASEVFCSHTRSYHYFISSINNENFVATKCESWKYFTQNKCGESHTALMGDDYFYQEDTTGKFFLKTNSEFSYAYD